MKKKILVITLVIILIVSILTSIVSAASFTASMTSSATTVKESTEFTVTIKVSNIDAGVNGINSVEGILSYDTAVFESLTTSSIDALHEWTADYNPSTGKLVLYTMSWVNTEQDIVQITLKTKSGTSGKTGYIKYTNIEASNNESEIKAQDVSTNVTVGNQTSSGGDGNSQTNTNNTPQQIPMNTNTNKNTNTNTNSNTNTNTNRNTNTNKNTNTNRNNNTNTNNAPQNSYVGSNGNNTNTNTNSSTSEEDIPYTGTSDNIMAAIFVVLVLAGISYYKYESIKEY